jgi:hypothetical protein
MTEWKMLITLLVGRNNQGSRMTWLALIVFPCLLDCAEGTEGCEVGYRPRYRPFIREIQSSTCDDTLSGQL